MIMCVRETYNVGPWLERGIWGSRLRRALIGETCRRSGIALGDCVATVRLKDSLSAEVTLKTREVRR